jgi:hypothetical protein
MTEPYYIVTKDELDMIKNDCAHPETNACDGCEYEGKSDHNPITSFNPCSFKGANALMDEVLERPLSEALRNAYQDGYSAGMDAQAIEDKDNLLAALKAERMILQQLWCKEWV